MKRATAARKPWQAALLLGALSVGLTAAGYLLARRDREAR